jgi:hypothetical protein
MMDVARQAFEKRGRYIPLVVLGIVTLAMPESWPVTVSIMAVLLVETGADLLDTVGGQRDELEQAKTLYAAGDITLAEFERRAELILDDEANRIRETVEEVGGIGPELSANIALAFDSLEDVEAADRETLQEVHGVGESTAVAVREYLRGSSDRGDGDASNTGATPQVRARATTTETDGAESQQVRRGEQRAVGSGDDYSVEEIQQMRELADRAPDEDDPLSLDDLESIPREILQDGSRGVEDGGRA